MDYNGSAIVAMAGKNCVGIAADRHLGQQRLSIAKTTKVHTVQPKVMVGFTGLQTDAITMKNTLEYRLNVFELQEERNMEPKTLSNLLSNLLYEKRFGPYYLEPIVAGLDSVTHQPFLSTMDIIGCQSIADDFCVAGNCSANLFGMAETFYKPNLKPDQLKECLAQTLMSSVDRNSITGWGGVVYIITPEGVTEYELKSRQD